MASWCAKCHHRINGNYEWYDGQKVHPGCKPKPKEKKMETCTTCDGTGEVHSHNPKCWDCNGKGIISSEKAEKLRKEEK